ncbi:MAG: hypothetical protein RBR86_10125 [Pseudobdellovibrionaceae bacterium]|jgi:hypothetical protein|nr:hypothetical protein [Pseudobdellovibrionaceae bacterium]
MPYWKRLIESIQNNEKSLLETFKQVFLITMYEIVSVPQNAYDVTEQLGTKFKFWFSDVDRQQKLFKQGRPGTGENWAEKVCCELAHIIGIPHAKYDFASWQGNLGIITPSIVAEGERLVLGNEIISPKTKNTGYANKHHLVRKLTSFLKLPIVKPPFGFDNVEELNANEVFIGYLMLDALVGNTDRHDENWGVILSSRGFELAPTYDHASSLGRELSNEVKRRRLNTKDTNFSVAAYASKARSALYETSEDSGPLSTLNAFIKVGATSLSGKYYWLKNLEKINKDSINHILIQIPDAIMSPESKDFAHELILFNKERLEETSSA